MELFSEIFIFWSCAIQFFILILEVQYYVHYAHYYYRKLKRKLVLTYFLKHAELDLVYNTVLSNTLHYLSHTVVTKSIFFLLIMDVV